MNLQSEHYICRRDTGNVIQMSTNRRPWRFNFQHYYQKKIFDVSHLPGVIFFSSGQLNYYLFPGPNLLR